MHATQGRFARLAALTLLGLGLVAGSVANAQDWPSRPIKMIVPFPAGGGTDFVARLMAQELTLRLGQTVVIENRGGANGALGLKALKQAEPDGYTIGATSDTPLTANPALFPSLAYKPLEDFTPVAPMVRFPSLILATPSAKIRTVAELIEAVKTKPGSLAYGSSGVGGFSHLAMELFALQAGIKLLHVPYRGAGPAAIALLSGEVQLGINNVQVTLQNIRAGQLVPVAVGELERMDVLPDVPTIAETLPGFRITSWAGIIAPAKTPKAITDRLQKEIAAVMADPKFTKRLEEQQVIPFIMEQPAFAEFIKAETAKWERVIKSANITLEQGR